MKFSRAKSFEPVGARKARKEPKSFVSKERVVDMSETERFESEKIGALWKWKTKKGTEYLRGVVNGERVVVFPTTKKWQENSPDYQVLKATPLAEKEEKEVPPTAEGKAGPPTKGEKKAPF